MSSVCDSDWSRDYRDDTGSRVALSGTRFVSHILQATSNIEALLLATSSASSRLQRGCGQLVEYWCTSSVLTVVSPPTAAEMYDKERVLDAWAWFLFHRLFQSLNVLVLICFTANASSFIYAAALHLHSTQLYFISCFLIDEPAVPSFLPTI